MNLENLAKIILYVRDMDKEVLFYRDILGLKIKEPAGLTDYSKPIWVEWETGECSLVFHYDPEKQLGQDRPKLVFKVADINQAHQDLTNQGVKLSSINSRTGNILVADGCDPEGNPFSIYTQTSDRKILTKTK
ncbi:MAG: hypothetical protein Tsb0014_20960 [Pleurocapsa sp.]